MINIIPKLVTLNLFDNDILFSQGDLAGELFFIFLGSIQLYIDLSELVDMTKKNRIINEDACFNIPLISTRESSYLGDNDVLLKKNGYRTMTGICAGDC